MDRGYVAALRDRFWLVMPDPRGQGQSDKPQDRAGDTVRRHVGDVLAVLEVEAIHGAHVWGYSMGGWVGFVLGAAAPDRVRLLVLGGAYAFGGNPWPIEGDAFLDDLRRGIAALVPGWEETVPNFWLSPGERARWLTSDAEALTGSRLQRLTEPDVARGGARRHPRTRSTLRRNTRRAGADEAREAPDGERHLRRAGGDQPRPSAQSSWPNPATAAPVLGTGGGYPAYQPVGRPGSPPA
ncbi:MAG: alpha/beta hydrolase [Chloroflexota bacterium]|nr:alpha/beta hydrolase [Chloroflexota bacterium]MDP9471747.1 alpha/beta hydrolase [Chloroflexota bacterium]